MGLSTFDRVLWLASATLPVVIVVRIIHQRLYTQPFSSFIAMLGVVVLRDLLLATTTYDSHPYILIWACTVPPLLLIQLNAGLQNLKSVARLYPDAGKSALRLFLISSALAAGACCLGLPFEFYRFELHELLLRTLFLLQRLVDGCMAGTLAFVALFFMRCPAPPRRPPSNLVLHTALLSFYFGGYGALFFIENLLPLGGAQTLERAQFCLVVVLYFFWATCLSSKGQTSNAWQEVDVILLARTASAGGHVPGDRERTLPGQVKCST